MDREPMWRRYLRFWGPSVREDVDDELRFHLETRTDAYVRAGMSRADAEARARAEFGDLAWAAAECRGIGEEQLRRRALTEWLDTLWRDLRHTVRSLRRSPGYAAAVIVTLALAIGLDTSVFTIVYAAAFRPLPVPDAANVVSVFQELRGEYSRGVHGSVNMVSLPEYRDYAQAARAFEGSTLAAVAPIGLALGGTRAAPVAGRLVSCNYFGVLRVGMARGRALAPDECAAPGGAAVAVVSHAFWRRALGADARVLGSTLTLNRHVVTVVGVADSGFAGTELDAAEIWLPVTMQPLLSPDRALLDDRNVSWLGVLGRLKPGATREGARADLAAVARRADAENPGRETIVGVERGAYLADPATRREGAAIAAAVLSAAGVVVLMACLNVMSLLLARAAARQRETGIRLALGASRARLVRRMLGEGAVLAAAGGAAGAAIAWWLPALLLRATPGPTPGLDLTPDGRVLAWAALLSLGTALAIALVPALQATRNDPAEALRRGRGARGGRGGGLARTRTTVVGAQLAGSLLFLVLAGLFVRGVTRARTVDLGFRTERVVALTVDLARQGYAPHRAAAFHATLRERVAALPGVESVALAAAPPLVARFTVPVLANGADGVPVQATYNVVSGTYFGTMGVALVRGRAFGDDAPSAGDERPTVVSESMARRLWPSAEPLGARFRSGEVAYRVVGVARDAHNVSLAERDAAFFYAAATRDEQPGLALLVRTAGESNAVAAALPRVVAALDPQVLTTTRTMEHTLAELLRPARAAALGATIFGVLAAALAAVGVYGIVAYGVSQRTREIGIRLALGAARRDVLADEARRARRVIVPGLAAGIALAVVAARAARGFLYGTSALDPLAFGGMTLLLVAVAAGAVLIPARRAARMDPSASLRTE